MAEASSRATLFALGLSLLLTLGVAFLFLGGVGSDVQVLLHLMVAGAAALALALPDRKLGSAGVALKGVFGGAVLLSALALGLIPIPRGVASFVAPGLLAARPDAAWSTLATDGSRVPGELATLALVVGFGALVAVWGAARRRRSEAELAIIVATGLVAVSAGLHAWFGATTVLGLVTPAFRSIPFFAPFVNGNHAASVMLLGGPVAVGVLSDGEQGVPRRTTAAVVAVVALLVLVWTGSNGAMLATVAVALMWALRARGLPLSGLGALVVALAIVAQVLLSAGWGGAAGTVGARAALWRDAWRMLGDFWLTGTGGGTFGEAIRAYRSDRVFFAYAHAHNDPLEWVVETGAIGMLALPLAVAAMWPGPLPRRADGFVFGLLGLLLHSMVEFPFQMPAIAMSAVGVAACAVGVFGPSLEVSPRVLRATILAVGLLQFPAAALQARSALVASAIEDVRLVADEPERAATGARLLEAASATGPERLLFKAWSAERAGDGPSAGAAAMEIGRRFPDRPDALREAALVLARTRNYEESTALLERASERDPSDYRAWVILARVAKQQGDSLLALRRWTEVFHRDAPLKLLAEAYLTLPSGVVWLEALHDADPRYSAELARLLDANGKPEEALLACEYAALLDPVGYGDLLIRGRLLLETGRPEEAESWMLQVVSRRPEDVEVLVAYADLLAALGRHPEATGVYLRAARKKPSLRARVLGSAEREGPDRALGVVRQFELEGNVDARLRLEIAAVRMRAGDLVGCREEIEGWNLVGSAVGPAATELLETCRQRVRPPGGQ